jgi:hypothetical protein
MTVQRVAFRKIVVIKLGALARFTEGLRKADLPE